MDSEHFERLAKDIEKMNVALIELTARVERLEKQYKEAARGVWRVLVPKINGLRQRL